MLGYEIHFIKRLFKVRARITKARTQSQKTLLQTATDDIINKHAVKKVTANVDNQFISTLFIIQQSDKMRPGLHLKQLNAFVETTKFKMEGLQLLRSTIKASDYLSWISKMHITPFQ